MKHIKRPAEMTDLELINAVRNTTGRFEPIVQVLAERLQEARFQIQRLRREARREQA